MNPFFPFTGPKWAVTFGSGASLLPPPPTAAFSPPPFTPPPPDPLVASMDLKFTEILRSLEEMRRITDRNMQILKTMRPYPPPIQICSPDLPPAAAPPLQIAENQPSPSLPMEDPDLLVAVQQPSPSARSVTANPDLSRPPLPLEDLDLDLLHPRPPLVELESPPVVDLPSPPLKTTPSSPELLSSPPVKSSPSSPESLLVPPKSLPSPSKPPLMSAAFVDDVLQEEERTLAAAAQETLAAWAQQVVGERWGQQLGLEPQAHQLKPEPETTFVLYPMEKTVWVQEMKIKPIFYKMQVLLKDRVGIG